jgi:hypothetical protein
MKKNAKRELSFFLIAARTAGGSPKGSKTADPPDRWSTPVRILLGRKISNRIDDA